MTIGVPKVGAATESASSISSNVPFPATVDAGDLLLLLAGYKVPGNAVMTVPAGWTQREQFSRSASASSPGIFIAYKWATGSEGGTSLTVAHTTANTVYQIYAISGVDTVTPFDVADSIIDSSTGSSTVIPAQSIATDQATQVYMGVQNSSTNSASPAAGFTETADRVSGVLAYEIAYKQGLPVGSSGATITWSGGVGSAGALIALKPSAGGAPPPTTEWRIPDGAGGWIAAEAVLPDGAGGWV